MAVDRPVLHLMCGLPGSGKTTRAAELATAGAAVHLNADAWTRRIFLEDAEAAARDGRKDIIEQMQWELAAMLLRRKVDVVLDWGLWTRAERDELRRRGSVLGADVRLEFLDAPLDELHRRLAKRNATLPSDAFNVSPAELDLWAGWFERPTAEEADELR